MSVHVPCLGDRCIFFRVRYAGVCSESELTFGFCVRLSVHVPCVEGRYRSLPVEWLLQVFRFPCAMLHVVLLFSGLYVLTVSTLSACLVALFRILLRSGSASNLALLFNTVGARWKDVALVGMCDASYS